MLPNDVSSVGSNCTESPFNCKPAQRRDDVISFRAHTQATMRGPNGQCLCQWTTFEFEVQPFVRNLGV